MPSLHGMKRVLIAGAFAAAAVMAPIAASYAVPAAVPLAACPNGEANDLYTDNCVPELTPNVPGGAYPTPDVTPPFQGEITESTPGDADSVPEVDGVPCLGGRSSGSCIGLEEDAVPPVIPHSTLSSSP